MHFENGCTAYSFYTFVSLAKFANSFLVPTLSNATSSSVSFAIGVAETMRPRAERLVQDSIAYAVCTGRRLGFTRGFGVNPPASATDFVFGASPNGFAPPKFGIETGRAL